MHENDRRYLKVLHGFKDGFSPLKSALGRAIFMDAAMEDEDVWRTTEEGKHFKFDNESGEIKAGFGGKHNGKKIGTSWKTTGSEKKAASEASRPVEMTAEQSASLKKAGSKIRNLKNEQYFIIGTDGENKGHGKGDQHSVAMTVGEKRELLKGAISLHNHPNGGPFSSDDLSDFGYGATAIYVSVPDGDYALKNVKYNTPEQYNGWYDMKEDMERRGLNKEVSSYDLMKKADANLKGNETRRKMSEISAKWVEMKNNGATQQQLNDYYAGSGYDALAEKAKRERAQEIRRLEVEPFHEYYKNNAARFGFEYSFTPAKKKTSDELSLRTQDSVYLAVLKRFRDKLLDSNSI